jgi:hypothetical protein
MADKIEGRESRAAGAGSARPRRWAMNVFSIVASASIVLAPALPAHGSNHLPSAPGQIEHHDQQRPPNSHAPAGGPRPRVLAIIVGATNDSDAAGIGSAVVTNIKNMRFLLGQMRSIAHLDTEEFDALDDHFDCQRINDILSGKVPGTSGRSLTVRRGVDTVLFYYAGHGYRDGSVASDKFPILWCSELNGPPLEDLRLSDIMGKVSNLRPRLAIGIADACNYAIGQESAGKGIAVPTEAHLRALFAGYQGMITMAAAKSGTSAWYSVVPEKNPGGGFFSNKLLSLINTQASWESITSDLIDPDTQDPIVVPGAGKNGASVIQQPITDDYHDSSRALRRLPPGG